MTTLQFVIVIVAQAAALSAIMAGAWLVQQRTGNSGWVDTTWSFGVGVVGLAGALAPVSSADTVTSRQLLTAALVAAWALRLGLHIARRSRDHGDDPRYADLARQWGAEAPRRMFRFLQIQAAVAIPLTLAVTLAAHNPAAMFRAQDIIACGLMSAALIGEAAADRQLRRFKADPGNKGQVCDTGLWALSRHPNYFFEWLGWLAYPLLAINGAGAYAVGWLALLAPAIMYWLLVHVSGIPPLEAHMLRSRPDMFRRYQARTSAFFPWLPSRR